MSQRAAVVLDPDAVGGDPNDYFPTPPWAARAGGELIANLDPMAHRRVLWECACGGGHASHGLSDYVGEVRSSDLVDRGNGEVLDFLREEDGAWSWRPPGQPDWQADWIVTNPPFSEGEAFVRTAWARARIGVAMLLRLQFLEGVARHRMFTQDCPLAVVAPFAERVPMVKGRWDPEASSATAYAWFVWLKSLEGLEPAPVVRWIAPGARERLTRPSDFEMFAPHLLSAAGDLFDGV